MTIDRCFLGAISLMEPLKINPFNINQIKAISPSLTKLFPT